MSDIDNRIKEVESQLQKNTGTTVNLQKELVDLYIERDNSTEIQRYYKDPSGKVFIKLRHVAAVNVFGVSYYAVVVNLSEMYIDYDKIIVIDTPYFKEFTPIEKEDFDNACLTFYNKIKDEIED